jgi:rhomboid protease GluP
MLRFGRPPPVTTILIVINSLVFAYGMITGSQEKIILHYGFIPNNLFQNGNYYFSDSILRLFTSMFVHANIAHISFNLFALAYMGGFAERSVGISRFVTLYIASGITGGLLHGVVSSYILFNGNDILIGASGAISGVLGVSAALGNIRGYYWLAIQVLYVFIGSFTSISIAFVAHVGGFITGLLLTRVMVQIERYKRKWD